MTSDDPANSGRRSAGRLSPELSAILGPWAKTEIFATSASASTPATREA